MKIKIVGTTESEQRFGALMTEAGKLLPGIIKDNAKEIAGAATPLAKKGLAKTLQAGKKVGGFLGKLGAKADAWSKT